MGLIYKLVYPNYVGTSCFFLRFVLSFVFLILDSDTEVESSKESESEDESGNSDDCVCEMPKGKE